MENNIIDKISITDHAYERARERLNWKKKILDKMSVRAFTKGVQHKDTKGSLHRYITKLWFMYKSCNNLRIYGENVYLFSGTTLITLYRINNKMKKHLRYIK